MSDKMRPMPVATMLQAILEEYQTKGTIFGIIPHLRAGGSAPIPFLDGQVETPIGPAAGPQTQLAQNIVAAYLAGARVFEVKTVQTLDGDDLPVAKPCIHAPHEAYNVEWSTELTVPEARDEYVKAHFLCSLLAKELGLGAADGFLFNMSVGYDFDGITSPKIDDYLTTMMNCKDTPIWHACHAAAGEHLGQLYQVNEDYLRSISPVISRSVTLSTLHGCPPAEIERIASYLLQEKGLHTYVKCNPTLLGYDTARALLDDMGYQNIAFDHHHFENDLQLSDAVPMLARLSNLAAEHGVIFGVKLTNTFPVQITSGELPGEEMYLSGAALYPLTLKVAEVLARATHGTLPMSYSGGADALHLDDILQTGIFPVTMSTTLLKPGGYKRLEQMAMPYMLRQFTPPERIDPDAIAPLLAAATLDDTLRARPPRSAVPKRADKVPLMDCFVARCTDCCPFGQDIPRYLKQVTQGDYRGALSTILERNPLPNMTGTICSHHCTAGCARNYYDEAIDIRGAKLVATERAWDDILSRLEPRGDKPGLKVAVIGGGPAGMATAFLLAREGAKVTIFERERALGGIVSQVIPSFRIPQDAIERDAALLDLLGVEVRLNTPAPFASALLSGAYTHVVLAVGAQRERTISIEGKQAVGALDFLRRAKNLEHFAPKNVVVIGGGNTAMDTARTAARLGSAPVVTLAYRRTVDEMPADLEELALAREDGVTLAPLRRPVAWDGETLTLERMTLGEADESGRRAPVATGSTEQIPCDLLLSAAGQQVNEDYLAEHGVAVDPKGQVACNSRTLETTAKNVYIAGDLAGGGSLAEAIAHAHKVANAIAFPPPARPITTGKRGEALSRKGVLRRQLPPEADGQRCLHCNLVCEHCVEVCPNRANVAIPLLSRRQTQIVHVDGLCNECGNCETFCPYDSAPYREKFTVFGSVEEFNTSEQSGFVLADKREELVRVRLDGMVIDTVLHEQSPLPSSIQELIETVCEDYHYLLY